MLAQIDVDGRDPLQELGALERWLRADPGLRGLVRRERATPGPDDMGALGDVLVATLGGGGAITALAASLSTWLVARRGQVSIKVSSGDRQVEIDIKSPDAEALLRTILAGGPPADPVLPPPTDPQDRAAG
jgi:membrane-associated two-gene conflict system component 1 (EACC1)